MEFGRASYFALAALIDGPLHGYAIVGRASELSGGAVRLSTGTLYGVLERATAEELVVAGRPYVVGGRQRRDYTLTRAGHEALHAEANRMVRDGNVVSRRLRSARVRFAQ
jgi:PadR family transcriptional regulator, regulatory protein PadR